MGLYSRIVLYVATGLLWLVTGGCAILTDLDYEIYSLMRLATGLASLWTLATILTRPDNGALAHARLAIHALRVEGAAKRQHAPDDSPTGPFRSLDRVK
uniref:hypothetical protein n=1 Tax=Herbidospora sakaeratensis TaxID=564415 RepID=UPI00078522C0|nr:hypothetical protein [Herbidospora sakaeratensis]